MLQFILPKQIPPFEDADGNRNVVILKLICGTKFYIAKTVNIEWMVDQIRRVYGKYHRGGIQETDLFYPLVRYVCKQDVQKIKIEILLVTTNGYEALKFELGFLEEFFGKKDCLNLNNIPHIPKTTYAKKGSNWLTMNQALNFRKLLTKYIY